jgi:hypothetical protein
VTVTRPSLPKLNPGDPVIITDPDHPGSKAEGHVVKAARVWVTIATGTPDNPGREYRMTLNGQSENTGYGYGGLRFATPEQHAYDTALHEAKRALSEAGIGLRYGSPWRDGVRLMALAEFIRTHETSPEA